MAAREGDGTAVGQVGFGALVRAYRERGLLSQEQLAGRSGLSARAIRDLEAGRVRRPRTESVRLLADALGLAGTDRERFERAARQPSLAGRSAVQPSPPSPEGAALSQLPPAAADFVGRVELASRLRQLLAGQPDGMAGAPDAAPAVCVVAGKAGVGKSALAVHVAHQLVADFPDGQLYASLRGGADPETSPLDPAEVLGRFLRALGANGDAIPSGVEERAGLYRSRLAGRRVLVVLDDAAGEAQVRPLLPGGASAAVLVTSRVPLTALEGARLVHLDVLEAGQAVELLGRIAGPERVAAEPQAAAAIVAACGRLPLAVRIAGARLAARQHWPLARMASLLTDERGRLDELACGDLEVRASLSLSYQGLGRQHRRLFRRLGLLAAPDVAGWVAGALLGGPPAQAGRVLEDLVDAQLVDVAGWDATGQPRYRLHDLLRAYAHERADVEEPAARRRAALERALGAWLTLAEQADQLLPSGLYAVSHGGAPRWPPATTMAAELLADPLSWFQAERVALVAAVEQAADAGLEELAWDLAGSLINFLDLRGYLDDWQHGHTAALAAVRRAGNLRGTGSLLRGFGYLSMNRGGMAAAMEHFERALSILGQVGDRRGQAHAMEGIGAVHRLQSRYAEAAACLQPAVTMLVQLGDWRGAAWTRFQLAALHNEQGELVAAQAELEEVLAEFRRLGDQRGVAWTQRRLGLVHSARGDSDRAAAWLRRSLAGLIHLGDRTTAAVVLRDLGELELRRGDRAAARQLFQQCAGVARELDNRLVEARALRSLGDLHRLEGDSAAAVRALERSVQLWRALDMPTELAQAVQGLGAAHLDAGSPAAARFALREALTLLEPGTHEAKRVAGDLEPLLKGLPAPERPSSDRA